MKWSTASTALLASPAAARLLGKAKCPNLEWSDEFNDPSTFDQTWTHQVGDGCDLSPDLCGWGNAEWQWYQPENTVIGNDMLVMQAAFDGDRYTSSRIRSKGKVAIDLSQPHYIEAKIKIAGGQGIWPAFWMMPDDFDELMWPAGGEIDIMEYVGREPHNAHGYFHYGNAWNDRSKKGGPLTLPDLPPDQFRTYAIEKTPNRITYLIDGYRYQSYTPADLEGKFEWPFEKPFYFLLNIAIGGYWPGNPDETTVFPTAMEVDYIRVYDIAQGNFGAIEGNRLVHEGQRGTIYCLASDSVEYTDLVWNAPDDAQVRARPLRKCALINFGSKSGYVEVSAQSECGERHFRIPVEVQPYFYVESTLVGPTDNDRAAYISSTGDYEVKTFGGNTVVQYLRDTSDLYDHSMYAADISEPDSFVDGMRKFYMDVIADTVASCTEVIIQLEDSSIATPDNYPSGRHSRYTALIENKGQDWERLVFKFEDQPDLSVSIVDRVVVLFNSGMLRGDKYYIANFDIASPTGQSSRGKFEPLSTNQCRAKVRSEAGACADGINNDAAGFDGEPGGPIDCEDADCWSDPVCNGVAQTESEAGFCADGMDQDGDGLVDCDDPDCANDPFCQTMSAQSIHCEQNAACDAIGLSGVCCPTKEGVYLYCCNLP